MFAYGAGIVKNKVGLLAIIGHFVAHFNKQTFDMLTVGNITLTTVCMNKRFGLTARKTRTQNGADFIFIFCLTEQFRFGHEIIFLQNVQPSLKEYRIEPAEDVVINLFFAILIENFMACMGVNNRFNACMAGFFKCIGTGNGSLAVEADRIFIA